MSSFNLMSPAEQLTAVMDRIYKYGMTTTSGGNLSVMDENGDIWITPSGIDKGSLTKEDIMQIKPNGEVIGRHTPSVELPFHKMIYEKRPDIKAIIHAHPPALVAFSLVRRIPSTRLLPSINYICDNIGMADYAVPGSAQLGANIAERFEQGYDIVLLENHGVVAGNADLYTTYLAFETLDFSARMEINARKLSEPVELTDNQLDMSIYRQNEKVEDCADYRQSEEEIVTRKEMCSFIHRSYDQRLFSSSQGIIACKLSNGTILLTPYSVDRKHIEPADIIRVSSDAGEPGNPAHITELVKTIFDKNQSVNTLILAQPPSIMAFAVTPESFETRTIPESYIQLRTIPKLPFRARYMQPELTADTLSESTPVVLIENDCVLATGNSLLKAFDRLEVAEYSASAILSAKALGELVAINDEQIREIEREFDLK